MRAAAFIDLDRTLLKGASGPIISRALREAGVGFDFNTWWGWFAPLGMPREAVRRLNAEIAALIAEPLDVFLKFYMDKGAFIGMTSFGASAPIKDLYKHFGITAENIVAAAKSKLK